MNVFPNYAPLNFQIINEYKEATKNEKWQSRKLPHAMLGLY